MDIESEKKTAMFVHESSSLLVDVDKDNGFSKTKQNKKKKKNYPNILGQLTGQK